MNFVFYKEIEEFVKKGFIFIGECDIIIKQAEKETNI